MARLWVLVLACALTQASAEVRPASAEDQQFMWHWGRMKFGYIPSSHEAYLILDFTDQGDNE